MSEPASTAAAQLQSALQATKGKVTGDSRGNYCLVSFPATWGQQDWNYFVNGLFDYACVWTGNNNSPMEEWFVPWKENVLEAQRKGMTLLVLGHEGCQNPGGAQIEMDFPERFRMTSQ